MVACPWPRGYVPSFLRTMSCTYGDTKNDLESPSRERAINALRRTNKTKDPLSTMGNVESAASAAKATMKVNKMMNTVGKEFSSLSKSEKKKEGSPDSKKQGAKEDSAGLTMPKFFEGQRRQSAISKE